jgi:multiple sugar transport system permease protein
MSGIAFVRRRGATLRFLRLLALYTIATLIAAAFLLPLLWMFSSALKTHDYILAETRINLIPPRPWQWQNFVDAWARYPFSLYLLNTLIIVAASLAGGLLSSSMVAYGFARLRFKGREKLFVLVLATMMLPGQVTTIPTFLLYHRLGWLNTWLPLILPYWLGGGAFYIFLLRQYILTIPRELDDAAAVDGCTPIGIYRHVILPNIGPALATGAIFIFVNTWNDLWGPMVYLSKQSLWNIAAGMLQFKLAFGVQASGGVQQFQLQWLMALATLTMLPVLIFYLAFQRYFVSGVVTSGIKG